jgi:hypothetical protein
MGIWQPGDEDVLIFEWTPDQQDAKNIYFILDERNPEQALRLRIGTTETTLAADEALTLLDWLGGREATLFALVKQQPIVALDHGEESNT